jgi:hypothetical protein
MKRLSSLFVLTLLTSPGLAQTPRIESSPVAFPTPTFGESSDSAPMLDASCMAEDQGGALRSNRNFPNFIGFMSNPLQSIDPRSLTQLWPVFLSSWVSATPALPSADFQVYGAGLNLALTDRFSVGLNQGGYGVAQFSKTTPALLPSHGFTFGGYRQGFLNLGGFAQYTVIEDVENQFLATAGVRLEVPSGSTEIFQGNGPAYLAPYATVGKEFGCFHVLATTGFQFPTRSGDNETHLFYFNAHLDRQCFGWIYPLVEVNCIYHTSSVTVDLPTRHGYIDLNNFDSSGNIVTLSAGVNFVLIRDRLEFVGCYTTSLATQNNFNVNGLLAKMILRY